MTDGDSPINDLTTEHRDLLINFEGYGSAKPSIVFMGQEERLGGELVPVDEIKARCSLIRKHGIRGDKNVWHSGETLPQPDKVSQWTYASKIVAEIASHCCQSVPNHAFPEGYSERWQGEYVRLGTFEGFTLLTERLPFPLASGARFPDTYLTRWYKNHSQMLNAVTPARLTMLQQVAASRSIQWVFMYGAPYREMYMKIVGPVLNWHRVPLTSGDAHFVKSGKKILVRTEFFGGMSRKALLLGDIPKLIKTIVGTVGLPDSDS